MQVLLILMVSVNLHKKLSAMDFLFILSNFCLLRYLHFPEIYWGKAGHKTRWFFWCDFSPERWKGANEICNHTVSALKGEKYL